MNIHFNPSYDSGVWTGDPEKGRCRTGEKSVGPMGLLGELELRLALVRPEIPRHRIIRIWHDAMKTAAEGKERFYKDSFRTDPLATALRVLSWRDALVLSGWDSYFAVPERTGSGARQILEDLAAVDAIFRGKGCMTVSDRWRAVIDALPGSGIKGITVTTEFPIKDHEPFWRNLFGILEEEGWTVDPGETGHVPENVRIERFRDYNDACIWAALQEDTLAVTLKSSALDDALAAVGRPYAGSVCPEGNNQVHHLFVDAMRICESGAAPASLRSWLSVSPHPLDSYKDDAGRSLRELLLTNLVSQNGFGKAHISKKTFEEIIDSCAKDDAGLASIHSWLPAYGKSDTVDCGKVTGMCGRLESWARKELKWYSENRSGSPVTEQLGNLVDSCGTMAGLLEGLGYTTGDMPTDDFRKLIKISYTPSSVRLHTPELDSMSVAPGLASVASKTGRAIWLDCSAPAQAYAYSFLSDNDIAYLKDAGLAVPSMQESIKQTRAAEVAGLSRIGELIIAFCDRVDTETPALHPLFIEIAVERARKEGKRLRDWLDALPFASVPAGREEPVAFAAARTQKLEYSLGEDFFKDRLPKSTSPSAIELLLERPFDWALSNALKLYDETDSNISTIQGTVAHFVIHEAVLAAMGGRDECTPEEFESVIGKRFDEFFEKALDDSGLELRLPENTLLLKTFRKRLETKSIPGLIKVLKHSGLVIVGSEVECSGDITCSGRTISIGSAYIDLLLRKGDEYVVFDFKWHGKTGRDKREKQIKNGEAYQLVLYKALVESGLAYGIGEHPVSALAFYMLATSELLTDCTGFASVSGGGDESIVKQISGKMSYTQSLSNLFDRYFEAVDAIKSGTLEEGEGMKEKYVKKDGTTGTRKRPDNSFGANTVLKGKLS